MRHALPVLALALLIPAWPLLFSGGYLADPLSELPARLWCHERIPLLGGLVDSAAFPNAGPLNQPDPLGTLVTGALRPLLGRMGAFNTYVLAQLAATFLATWALGRELVGDPRAALVGAVCFALTPLALVYGVSGAVVDLLTLWPWPLAARSLLRAWRAASEADRGGGPGGAGARAGWADAALAGLWAAMGFLTSPYNVLVFAAAAVPAFAWIVGTRGAISPTEDLPPPSLRRLLPLALVIGAAGIAVAGPYAMHMQAVMADPTSQMSEESVSATRHTWPFPLLAPSHTHRYTAFLLDYVAVGKDALIERVAAARFYRAFSPGLTLLALAGAGLVLTRRRAAVGVWLATAGFAALASLGPWLPVTPGVALAEPVNPAWWILRVLPGGSLLLEPFRYGLALALALAMAGTIGAYELARRFGAWVPYAAVGAWLVELVALSPVPMPLPTARLEVPTAYTRLDEVLGPGAILELPYFDRGSDRFHRVHFLHQLVHGRPIADEVLGFPPRHLVANQFTAALLAAEKSQGALGVSVTDPARVDADRTRLAADGFAGIVLDPSGYVGAATVDRVRALLAPLGEPVSLGEREVWVLAPR